MTEVIKILIYLKLRDKYPTLDQSRDFSQFCLYSELPKTC